MVDQADNRKNQATFHVDFNPVATRYMGAVSPCNKALASNLTKDIDNKFRMAGTPWASEGGEVQVDIVQKSPNGTLSFLAAFNEAATRVLSGEARSRGVAMEQYFRTMIGGPVEHEISVKPAPVAA